MKKSSAFASCMLTLVAVAAAAAQESQQPAAEPTAPVWQLQDSGTKASFRGLCAVDGRIAWASGSNGTVLRTTDGGETWESVGVAGESERDFRDIQAFDANTAVVICVGSPGLIFRTEDGGKNWSQTYRNDRDTIFFDALAFWDRRRGIAFSDPQNGRFFLIKSDDGGKSWSEIARGTSPEAHPGEAAFAASGTSLVALDEQQVWLATGGEHGPQNEQAARVFYSEDAGATWNGATTPLASTASSGIFSLAFANIDHGVAVGGDYQNPNSAQSNVAITDDSGRHWRSISGRPPSGYRSCVAVFNLDMQSRFVAVGPTGTDVSSDWGESWSPVDNGPFHVVAFSNDGRAGWAAGPDGRIAKWIGDAVVGQLAEPRGEK